jgi:hypothetical protein
LLHNDESLCSLCLYFSQSKSTKGQEKTKNRVEL